MHATRAYLDFCSLSQDSIDVTLEREGRQIKMPMPAPAGSCGFCHSVPATLGEGWPKGRIYAP